MHTSTTQPRNSGPEPLPSSTAPRPFGLRVRVPLDTTQRFLFGADGPSLPTRLAEELCVLVARIVVSDWRVSTLHEISRFAYRTASGRNVAN